jgi:hypothetical protein
MKEYKYSALPVDLKKKFLIKLYRGDLVFYPSPKKSNDSQCVLKLQSGPRTLITLENDELSSLKKRAGEIHKKTYESDYQEMRQDANILHDKVQDTYDRYPHPPSPIP